MKTENLTFDEKLTLWKQLNRELGWYPIAGIGIEDVEDRLEQMLDEGEIETMPSEDEIHQAMQYVARKAHIGDDVLAWTEWAVEVAIKNKAGKPA
jgi:hypothetical protein